MWAHLRGWSAHDTASAGTLWLAQGNSSLDLNDFPVSNEPASLDKPTVTIHRSASDFAWDVFSETDRRNWVPREMVLRSLNKIRDDQYARKDILFSKLRSWDEWLELRNQYRGNFRRSLGVTIGGNTPLNPRVSTIWEDESVRVEGLIFESLPSFYVTANIFIPKLPAGRKSPAIIHVTGHVPRGRLSKLRQSLEMAKHGYLVLCIDAIEQGEQRILINNGYSTRPHTGSHYAVGAPCTLTGSNLAGYMVNDVVRAIDYLETRPEVDTKRIIMTGESGGGTLTSYVMALDERIYAAAPVSSNAVSATQPATMTVNRSYLATLKGDLTCMVAWHVQLPGLFV